MDGEHRGSAGYSGRDVIAPPEPLPIDPFSAADEERLQLQGWDDLYRRVQRGIVIHPVLWLLVSAAGGLFETNPRLVVINAAIFIANVVIRLWRGQRHTPGRAPFVFLTLVIANAFHWGVLAALSLHWAPLEIARWPIWLATASVASAGTMGLAINHRVRWGYSLAALMPTSVVLALDPTRENFLIVCMAVVGVAYLIGASRVVHDDYWSAVRTRLELEASRRLFQRLSFTDALTQLPNRLLFDQSLAREWQRSKRAGSSISVLVIDIDHFKRVNDELGHAAGDAALQAVASALAAGVKRGDDVIARYGGEEFIVLLPDTGPAAAREVGERLRRAVADLRLVFDGRPVRLTCSIGLASARPAGRAELRSGVDPLASPAATVAAADHALYRAKRDGRDRIAGMESASAESRDPELDAC